MSLPDISYEELETNIAESLSNVFETMISSACVLQNSEDLSSGAVGMPRVGASEGGDVFVGSVGFLGDVNGVVYLYLDDSLMKKIASKMTDLPAKEVTAEIATDLCGELANMFGGGLKTGIAKLGHESTLTIPTVLSGQELFISTLGVSRYIRTEFSLLEEALFADLALANFV